MANHIQTNLIVIGNKADVTEFVARVDDGIFPNGELNVFSFDKLIPCPVVDNRNEWGLANWGCKWSAYGMSAWNINTLDDNHVTAEISYQTPWSPASAFFLTVSKMFPKLTFKHSFADEGCYFLGSETFQNGEQICVFRPEWNSSEGADLRCELGLSDEDKFTSDGVV